MSKVSIWDTPKIQNAEMIRVDVSSLSEKSISFEKSKVVLFNCRKFANSEGMYGLS